MSAKLTPGEEVNLRLECLKLTDGIAFKDTGQRLRIADAYYKFVIGISIEPKQPKLTEDKEA